MASWRRQAMLGKPGRPALDPPPGRRPPGRRPGWARVRGGVPPSQPMPGTGPVLPGDEQILAEDKRVLINQKLDNGGNTLIIFSSRRFLEICLHSASEVTLPGRVEGQPRQGAPHPREATAGGHSEGPQEARGDRWAGRRHAHTSGQLGAEREVRAPQNQERWGPEEELGRGAGGQRLPACGTRRSWPHPAPARRILTGSLLSTHGSSRDFSAEAATVNLEASSSKPCDVQQVPLEKRRELRQAIVCEAAHHVCPLLPDGRPRPPRLACLPPEARANEQSGRSVAGGPAAPRRSGPAAHGPKGEALARGATPRRALLGTHTGLPGLTLCCHRPHRCLMTCNAGPADGAAGPALGAESRGETPPLPPTCSSGATRPRPRGLAGPCPAPGVRTPGLQHPPALPSRPPHAPGSTRVAPGSQRPIQLLRPPPHRGQPHPSSAPSSRPAFS